MNTKKILFCFGTRPEAIKMAPLINKLKKEKLFTVKVCITAQHRSMLDEVLKLFKIKPDYDLNIMQDGQTLYHITTASLLRVKEVLDKEKPDMVLVHGDTTTTFASSLASFYEKIPVGHVEAGLRSYDKHHPFPEEANRLLTDALSELYFAPTSTSKKALLKENISPKKIFVTGNTVIDALYDVLKNKAGFVNPVLSQKRRLFETSRMILVTAHRRENFGEPLKSTFRALRRIADDFPDVNIVYPVHLNPNVQEPAKAILGNTPNVFLVPPLDYNDMSKLIKLSYIVVTDSGGLQEEAPSLGKPVLVLRQVTERPEAVVAGTVKIVGTDEKRVYTEIFNLLTNKKIYEKMARSVNPYGDGGACERIIETLKYYFKLSKKKPAEFY
jgi:UDP-N-acetylglucosamine 2-epimerase (non-hydrolysing)